MIKEEICLHLGLEMVKNRRQLLPTDSRTLLFRERSWVILMRKIEHIYRSLLTGTERAFVRPGLLCHSPLDNIIIDTAVTGTRRM